MIATQLSRGSSLTDEHARYTQLNWATYHNEGELNGPSFVEWVNESQDECPTVVCVGAGKSSNRTDLI